MIEIPASHLDLLERPIIAVLTTFMPNGWPQMSLVWCDYQAGVVRVNTTRERQKSKNITINPLVNLVVIDPTDSNRYIEIRGEAYLSEVDAISHLDKLAQDYTGKQPYYGTYEPVEKQHHETRVICHITPTRVNVNAVH